MASVQQGAPAPVIPSAELVVISNPRNLGFSGFVGSRAMLEAEGIIPDGIKWPAGYDDLRWQDGRFDYWLRRQRPEGAKGPRRDFLDCDWWGLRWEPINSLSQAERNIQLKTKELKDEIYRNSAHGRAEWLAARRRMQAANADQKFQEFKALLPGFAKAKRGRPTKTIVQSQGAAA